MVASVLCANCQPITFDGETSEPTHNCLVGHTMPGVLGGWQCRCPCPKVACTCGFGGFHDDINPRCALNAATPGRDELRGQIAAAERAHGVYGVNGSRTSCRCRRGGWMSTAEHAMHRADAVLPVVDTWVAAHAAENERLRHLVNNPDRTAETYVANAQKALRHLQGEVRDLTAAVAQVRALGEAWVGFDESHHYGDAILKITGTDPPPVTEPTELPYGTMLLTHDPLKEQGY